MPGAAMPEAPLREGRANMQRGLEAVGGRLVLTPTVLRFEPHSLNLQTQPSQIPLAAITGMRYAWAKAFGVLPLVPTSIVVSTADGGEHSFVLPRRAEWMRAIEQAVARARDGL